MKIHNYKIAFVGWNPFQLLQVKTLLLSMPNSVFIIEKRLDNNVKFFSDDLLIDIKSQILIVNQRDMKKLDEQYDVIITQTIFRDIYKIKNAKIIMLQYGYAKEPYNYGSWRALSSLCLTYGEYASKKISPLCPTVEVGNPRYDVWHNKNFHNEARRKYEKFIDKKKKTILYMPTWGELSSFNIYIDSIIKLNKSYNLLIKLHHNTDYLELGKIDNIKSKNITYFGANDNSLELLSVSDIVISDYSGAIFDAIYCDKPVVLLDLPREKLLKSKKMDIDSLEFNQRDIIGTRVSSTKELELTINSISEKKQEVSLKLNQLKTKLFIQTNSVKKNIENAILDLMNGKYEKTQTQRYINKTVVELYTKRCLWDIIRRRLIEIYLYVISLRRKND